MGRDLELERAWRDRMGRHESSGLTIERFCKQEGLAAHQLSWWRRELKRRDAEAGRANGKRKTKRSPSSKQSKQRDAACGKAFVPVQITASQLSLILEGIELESVRRRKRYRLRSAG